MWDGMAHDAYDSTHATGLPHCYTCFTTHRSYVYLFSLLRPLETYLLIFEHGTWAEVGRAIVPMLHTLALLWRHSARYRQPKR
jgi:hypothetical protein